MVKDINGYFDYLQKMIDECEYSKLTDEIKEELNKKISLFKITGYCHFEDFKNGCVNNSFKYQLYLLFEEVSKYVFKTKTYKNWLKE
jgi:hypothetical protein